VSVYWIKKGNAKEFNLLLEKLCTNPELREEMGEKGYNYMMQHYTVAQSYRLIVEKLRDE